MHMAATLNRVCSVSSMALRWMGRQYQAVPDGFGGYTSARRVDRHCLSESKLACIFGRRRHQLQGRASFYTDY